MANLSYCLLLCLLSHLAAALSRCYYPNRDEATEDFPCDPEAEFGPCCGAGSMCLSNRSCKGPGRTMIRGSCTDKNWDSLECPLYCYLAPNLGPDLISCSNVTKTSTSFCCDGASDCCNTGFGMFEVLPPNPEPWATWDSTQSQFVVVKPLPAAATTSSSTSTTASDTAATTSAAPTNAETTPTTPATTSASETAQTSLDDSTESNQAESSGLSTGAQAGIGAGAGVGAILLGVIAYLVWRLRRGKKNVTPPEQDGQMRGPLSPEEMYAYYNPAEMSAEQRRHTKMQWPGELDGSQWARELDGSPMYTQPVELPAGRR